MVNYQSQLDEIFLALAHPLRRSILRRAVEGACSVGEATQDSGVSKPAISKHLKVLEKAGLLRREVQGRRHILLVQPDGLTAAAGWIQSARGAWSDRLDKLDKILGEPPRSDNKKETS